MQPEADHRKSGFTSSNITPEKSQRIPRTSDTFPKDTALHSQENKRRIHYTPHVSPDKYRKTPHGSPDKYRKTPQSSGSFRKDTKPHSQENKRRIHHTPHGSPHKYQKTPQSSESFEKDARSHPESHKRKFQTSHSGSPGKIQKTSRSGKFLNALIGQWSKHMGIQTPLSQTGSVQPSPSADEATRKSEIEDQKVQILQKKLQAAEETISSLSASHEAELRAKEDILLQLNSDWESISKYYSEISESLKGFQEHKDNLSMLYNNVIVMQQSTVKKLQEELGNMKLKDDERRNIVTIAESKVTDLERRVEELMFTECKLKKQLEEMENKLVLEKNRLESVHTEEKLELIKKEEKLALINKELQLQLKKLQEEKRNVMNLTEEKDKSISQLEEKIVTCKNQIEDLLRQNTELNAEYEKSVAKAEELSEQLESKIQEIDRLRENLSARQEIESSLAKDLQMIENKYRNTKNDFMNLENNLKTVQHRNSDLESLMDNMKGNNERKIVELSKKIEILEKDKERILSQKRIKIQDLENSCKILQEKHESEVAALKKDFDSKLGEMKKTIASQSSAFTKLNETLNKMNAENQKKRTQQHSKESYSNSQSYRKDMTKTNVNREENIEPNLVEANETHGTSDKDAKWEEFKRGRNDNTQKTVSKKGNLQNQEQEDVYDFNTTENNQNLQKILSPLTQERKIKFDLRSPTKVTDYTETYSYVSRDADLTQSNLLSQERPKGIEQASNATQKKKIFKTRSTGLKQYGTPRKIFKK